MDTLREHVKANAQLDKDTGGGTTARVHLESVFQQTGKMPKALLEVPEMPDEYLWVHDQWHHVRTGVPSNGFGLGRISWDVIYFYCQLTRIRFSQDELMVIMLIDSWWVAEVSDTVTTENARSKVQQKRKR